MFTLRPAFPTGFYVVGAATTTALLLIAVLRTEPDQSHLVTSAPTSHSPQILAMEMNQ